MNIKMIVDHDCIYFYVVHVFAGKSDKMMLPGKKQY